MVTFVSTVALIACGDQPAANRPVNAPANSQATPSPTVNTQVTPVVAMSENNAKPDEKGKPEGQPKKPKVDPAASALDEPAPPPPPKKKN